MRIPFSGASAKWLTMVTLAAGLFVLSAAPSQAQFPFHKKKKINKSTSEDNTAAPDKILYDRAMDNIKHGRHEVGRLTMQTLINTYPDSEYLAKAKLAIADFAPGPIEQPHAAVGLDEAVFDAHAPFINVFPTGEVPTVEQLLPIRIGSGRRKRAE